MRTIRNITFVVLCAIVYVQPTSATVRQESGCWADHVYTSCVSRYFLGECDNCDENAWYMAIASCNSNEIMLEYFCSEAMNMMSW